MEESMKAMMLAAAVILFAGSASADTLKLTLTETVHDIEQNWVLEDVSAGKQAPLTARSEDGAEMRLEVTVTLLEQDMVLFDLLISERPPTPEGEEPARWKEVCAPRIQVLAGEQASVRQGRSTSEGDDYTKVELVYERARRF